ncbi:restriction endonuclease [Ascidiaceihabitans sp.]|uniref:restriction endonuclease n=1 Tax=Ascidiaceihabitans sp. TaxID=1872644 RepID=UPI003299E448
MAGNWREYQEEAAEFFRGLGLKANTDVTVQGVRTKHDIDVLVEMDVAGFSVRWLVECKHWATPVNKLHVMGLREIVSDLGADRGILLCEVGFQSGSIEAANLTNVQVSSLSDLSLSSREAISAFRLKELFDRNVKCRMQYWEISKDKRIEHGLRPGVFDYINYSGARVVDFVDKYLGLAFRGAFPINVDPFDAMLVSETLPNTILDVNEAFLALEPLIVELEQKLGDVQP